MAENIDTLVVGGGIAGLSAALAAARVGRRTLVLTGDALGGHLITIERIDGYPGFPDGVPGYDLCPIVQEQAAAAGAEFEMTNLDSLTREGDRWVATTPSGRHTARTVVVATGTALKALGVPGERSLHGKGVSHCASCDAPLLRGREAVVAGGGDSAMQEALTLAEHLRKVTIVHHGAELAGQAAYRQAIEGNAKIERRAASEIVEIVGQDAVTGVRLKSLDDGTESEIECGGVFVFVGLAPKTDLIGDMLNLDASGHVLVDAEMRSVLPGLFAAGTVRSGTPGRAAAAAGDGETAALAADRYLRTGDWR